MNCGEPMQAIVLAGGKSTRMGRDKSLMEVNGRSLIRITLERLIETGHSKIVVYSADKSQTSRQADSIGNISGRITWRQDPSPYNGVIESLRHAMMNEEFDSDRPLQISPVDTPDLNPDIYAKLRRSLLANVDVVVPISSVIHPLHALVRITPFLEALDTLGGPIASQIKSMRWRGIQTKDHYLRNLNSPADV